MFSSLCLKRNTSTDTNKQKIKIPYLLDSKTPSKEIHPTDSIQWGKKITERCAKYMIRLKGGGGESY